MIRQPNYVFSNDWSWMTEELGRLHQSSLYRSLKSAEPMKGGKLRCEGRELLNLCSNNYLGISEDLDLATASIRNDMPMGATASRLVVGNHPSFKELETTMAELKGTESCLVFSCGYMANIGAISALVGRGDAIYNDRLNHASIIDGTVLSGARHFRYRHGDPDHLEYLLRKHSGFRRRLIITESVYSMDGDQAPLNKLVELKEKYQAILIVDEAHCGGIYGENGAGLVKALHLSDRVDVQMGTFSKAYGCFGGYIVSTTILTDYLINKARSFIFTTGLPPIINALNLQAVRLCKKEDWRRRRLFENASAFRKGLKKLGLNIGQSNSHIIPLILGSERRALALSDFLWNRGIAAIAIRPPTVPKDTARLRFSIMATHEKTDLERCLEVVKEGIDAVN